LFPFIFWKNTLTTSCMVTRIPSCFHFCEDQLIFRLIRLIHSYKYWFENLILNALMKTSLIWFGLSIKDKFIKSLHCSSEIYKIIFHQLKNNRNFKYYKKSSLGSCQMCLMTVPLR
jgi:hypothetical protein